MVIVIIMIRGSFPNDTEVYSNNNNNDESSVNGIGNDDADNDESNNEDNKIYINDD